MKERYGKERYGGALITVLLCLTVFGTIGFLGIKLVPIYIEHFGVTSSLASMAKERSLHGKPIPDLRVLLDKRLKINDVHRVRADEAKINAEARTTTIRVAYEVQVSLLNNVDLLVTFDDRAILR
jgi:hypothetical protein